jgi:hypothetical protein
MTEPRLCIWGDGVKGLGLLCMLASVSIVYDAINEIRLEQIEQIE